MATIIKSGTGHSPRRAAFNFDDLAGQAEKYLDKVRQQAAEILRAAAQEAEQLRVRAQQEGYDAGMADAEQLMDQRVAAQLETLLPAMHKAIDDLHHVRHEFLREWERQTVHLAAEIAARIIRRELKQSPEITLSLVREALELAAGSPHIRLLLNPAEQKALGPQIDKLLAEFSRLGPSEVVGDEAVARGGCIIETAFGRIDQQWQSQLERIEAELS